MKRLSADDPRRQRAMELRKQGYSQREILRLVATGAGTLDRWLADVPRGERKREAKAESELTPPCYASGYRYFNTRW